MIHTCNEAAVMAHSGDVGGIGRVSDSPVPRRAASPEVAPVVSGSSGGCAAQWVCVQHRAGLGAQARHSIRAEGFDVHWPRLVTRQPRSQGGNDVLVPLFPGYLFARIESGRNWGAIALAANVLAILGAREFGRPSVVPARLVETLIQRAGAMDLPIDETPEGRALMRPGPVWLSGGSLDALKGLLVADKGEARVKVLLEVMGRQVEVMVAREQVRQS